MSVVVFVARSGGRRRVVAAIGLAVLLAIGGGVVLAAWAGARRTQSAFARLEQATNQADLIVTPQGDEPSAFDPTVAQDSPSVVKESAQINGYAWFPIQPDGTLDLTTFASLLAPVDSKGFDRLDHPLVIDGRLPDPANADEVMVDELIRDQGHPAGSTLDACLFDLGDLGTFSALLEGSPSADQQRTVVASTCAVHHFHVVGVQGKSPDSVVVRTESEREGSLMGSVAFVAQADKPNAYSFVLVDLAPGADVDAYVNRVLDRAASGAGATVQATSLHATVVARTVEPHVRALVLFAVIAAIATLGVLGPAVARWAAIAEPDRAPLRAAGLCGHQLRLACALRGAVLGLAAAAAAIAVAFAASGLFPIGIATTIEPSPGLRADAFVLAVGGAAIVLSCAAFGALASTRVRVRPRRPSRVADGLQARGVAPAVVAGVRAALSREGGATSALPAAIGLAIAIGAVVTALTYQAGLGRFLDTPPRYGYTWDATISSGDSDVPADVVQALDADRDVTGYSLVKQTELLRDGTAVGAFEVDPVRGSKYPTIVEGRAPRGDGEIALGGQTLDRFGMSVGDRIALRGTNGTEVEVTVVGRTLIPLVSVAQDLSIGEAALVDAPLIDRIGGASTNVVIVDLAPGVTAADLPALLARHGVALSEGVDITGPTFTADLRGYDAVRNTPLLLAGLLSVLGFGVLAHTIATNVRRRRRELAVLRCVGFESSELRATVRWEAVTVTLLCLVVAVPLGVAAGRSLWTAFADHLGVVDDAITPLAQVAAVVAATLAGAVAITTVPARRAARVRPAEVLRSE